MNGIVTILLQRSNLISLPLNAFLAMVRDSTCILYLDNLLNRDTGLYHHQSVNPKEGNLSLYYLINYVTGRYIFWRSIENALTIQEYCVSRNRQPKYQIRFPSILNFSFYLIFSFYCTRWCFCDRK